MRIVFSDEASEDAIAAFRFYEDRSEGLGERFRDYLGIALALVQRRPEHAPVVYRELRRKLVERFPYAVFYRHYPGVIYVVAVMHVRRSPASWKRRTGQSGSK